MGSATGVFAVIDHVRERGVGEKRDRERGGGERDRKKEGERERVEEIAEKKNEAKNYQPSLCRILIAFDPFPLGVRD